jgi:RNA recognition motif-containing protein
MATRIYVGNLPYTVTNDQLAEMFAPYGQVGEASVVMDRDTGRSKGFGFIEMADDAAAQAAIAALNGQTMGDRSLTVNLARPREDRSRRGGSRW